MSDLHYLKEFQMKR